MEDPGESGATIAIVGLACHFPGARDAAELHELTVAARRMFRPLPALPSLGRPLHGALLDGWAPAAAPYCGTEAGHDPGALHKLSAETIGIALADAGVRDLAALPGRAEVIVASTDADLPGDVLSGLLGGEFGVTGTAEHVAPSAYLGSLHAICAGCALLRAGEAGLVIAGGAQVGVAGDWLTRQAAAGLLGTGEMRVYDAEPAGLLPGDGCGIVVLMRSADARTAGLPVYAEITGCGTVPGTRGPELRRIYERAGIDPGDVQFIEGFGAGTTAGELAELSGLAGLRHGGQTTAALGAVSASLGYLAAAAGAASLIKTVAAMVAGVIPPGTGCTRPHRLIESGVALLRLPQEPEPWPEGTRLAAVNSPGTADPAADGAHLLLRRVPEITRASGRRRRTATAAPVPAGDPSHAAGHIQVPAPAPAVFALCGAEPGAMAAALEVIAGGADELGGTELGGLSRRMTVAATRSAERGAPVRLALTASGPGELAAVARRTAGLLRQPLPALTIEPGIAVGAGASGMVAVAFPGLALTPAEHSATLAAGLAGLAALEQLGVTPAAGAGYSMGELTGLVWAGCLSPAEAARLAAQRGYLLRGCGADPAAMARIAAGAKLVQRLCERHAARIVAYEAPAMHLVTGPAAGVRDLAADAARLGVATEVLPAVLPLHSPVMARCAAPLRAIAARIPFRPPRRPLASAVSGRFLGPADDIAELLANQLASPVLFSDAIALAARKADLIVVTSLGGAAGDRAPVGALAAAAAGLPAITLPPTALPAAVPPVTGPAATAPAGCWAPPLAALFAAGALTDLTRLLTGTGGPAEPPAWSVPAMREHTDSAVRCG